MCTHSKYTHSHRANKIEKKKNVLKISSYISFNLRNLFTFQATADLREAFKQPEAISSLCQIIVASVKPEIRQYAAVLLRKHIAKLRVWQTVPLEQQIQ